MNAKQLIVDEVTRTGGITLFNVEGAVDGHTALYFEQVLSGSVRSDARHLILDFTKVGYISSAGIGVFIAVQTLMRSLYDADSTIVIVNVRPEVKDVFKLLGIEGAFRFAASREDALAELNPNS